MNNGESKNIGVGGIAETANLMRSVPASFHRGVGRVKTKRKKCERKRSLNFVGSVRKNQSHIICAGRTMQSSGDGAQLKRKRNLYFASYVLQAVISLTAESLTCAKGTYPFIGKNDTNV